MKICIIGAGFTGLTLGYYLSKAGYKVTIFEKSDHLGGLASGIKIGDWYIDRFYHHIFSSDKDILKLTQEIGFDRWMWKTNRTTSTYINDRLYPFSSALDLLSFSAIPMADRIRTGIATLFLKLKTNEKGLEKTSAVYWLVRCMGRASYRAIWEPLLVKKFSPEYAHQIIASWLWARVYKRTFKLGYPEGGFENLAQTIAQAVTVQGGRILLNTEIKNIHKLFSRYDKVVYTGASQLLPTVASGLPAGYVNRCRAHKSLGALALLVEYQGDILKNNYWININSMGKNEPVCIVNHTGFIPRRHYHNRQLLYMAGYYRQNDPFFRADEPTIRNSWFTFLKRVERGFDRSHVAKTYFFREQYAQPVMDKGYRERIPPFQTPSKNLWMVNIDQIYPYDRGVNYAVAWAKKALPFLVKQDR